MPTGTIKKSTGSWYEILSDDFKVIPARVKGKLRLTNLETTNPVAVGDHVEYHIEEKEGIAAIDSVLQRQNYIIRKANNLSHQSHIIAANLNQLLVFATVAMPRTSYGFIDRLLLTAEAYEIPAIIFFNKVDICTPEQIEMLNKANEIYTLAGYKVLSGSVLQNKISFLQSLLYHQTTLISGHSGTGKSSLINALRPILELKTGIISAASQKGKHTTTFAEMHVIDEETFIIDTPGIKDFGVVDMKKEEISHYFPEMRKLLGMCQFNNCLHINEPGCAVLKAIENGEISPERYESYLSILRNDDNRH